MKKPFATSPELRTQIKELMQDVPHEKHRLLFEILGTLAAEVEVYLENDIYEKLRKQWADVLGTNLSKTEKKTTQPPTVS